MPITIERFDANQLQEHLPEFIDLLCDTVNNGGSVNFLAPFAPEDADCFWQKIIADLPDGARIVLAALDNDRVVGSVQLVLATQPNGPHRAEVQKLFVHSAARRQGIARLLMAAIEDEARTHQRTLLVLDTERGSHAESLYEQIGYQRAGGIPGFALNTAGKPSDNVIFYKNIV